MSTHCFPGQNWVMVTGKNEMAAVAARETGWEGKMDPSSRGED